MFSFCTGLLFFSSAFTIWVCAEPFDNKSNVVIAVSFANDTSKSYNINTNSHQKYSISQIYSWSYNDRDRFNLLAYSFDDGPYTMIPRAPQGNFTLMISTDSNHSISFMATKQFKVTVTGTNMTRFSPASPTKDNWFDNNSEIQITVPYLVPSSQENIRQQLSGWSIDNSDTNVISRRESGSFESPKIEISGDHNIEFDYKSQYYIHTISDFGRSFGDGWYDSGTIANVSVVPGDDLLVKHIFTGWQGSLVGGDNQEDVSVFVDSPKTLVATWFVDYTDISIIAISAVGIVVIFVIYRGRKSHFRINRKNYS